MPYHPLEFRPPPVDAVGLRSAAPAAANPTPPDWLSWPAVMPPAQRKPVVRCAAMPRPRRLGSEPAINMQTWDVDPARVTRDLGL